MISGARRALTLATACCTPFPPYRAGSPSRSSSASCAPVEAPEGTAARPEAPSLRRTSTSTVGFPRESRISRACTAAIFGISAQLPDFIQIDAGEYVDEVFGRGRAVRNAEDLGDKAPVTLADRDDIARVDCGGGPGHGTVQADAPAVTQHVRHFPAAHEPADLEELVETHATSARYRSA